MKTFLMNNWLQIAILVAFLIYAGVLAYKKKWEQLRRVAYRLIIIAERVITGTKQGQQRFDQVFGQVYGLVPAWFRFWFPEDLVKENLQYWYLELKDYLDNGKIDNSHASDMTMDGQISVKS